MECGALECTTPRPRACVRARRVWREQRIGLFREHPAFRSADNREGIGSGPQAHAPPLVRLHQCSRHHIYHDRAALEALLTFGRFENLDGGKAVEVDGISMGWGRRICRLSGLA